MNRLASNSLRQHRPAAMMLRRAMHWLAAAGFALALSAYAIPAAHGLDVYTGREREDQQEVDDDRPDAEREDEPSPSPSQDVRERVGAALAESDDRTARSARRRLFAVEEEPESQQESEEEEDEDDEQGAPEASDAVEEGGGGAWEDERPTPANM